MKGGVDMASKVFAAIDVGSNELSMKVYEITPKKGAREIDYVNSTVELGSDTYNSGRITEDSIMKVCEILNKFRRKMREYDVREYKAYASSAVREAENSVMVLERIKQHTGIDVSVLSNSEQRGKNYLAFAAKSKFEDADTKNRALLDIGAGSLQISIFDKQNLIQTQNLPIGAVRIRDYLAKYGADTVARAPRRAAGGAPGRRGPGPGGPRRNMRLYLYFLAQTPLPILLSLFHPCPAKEQSCRRR